MSHESVIASLKKLIKQDLLARDPKEHARHIMGESDRTGFILHAALIEDMLVRRIQALMPSINGEERERLFNFEGPCGSFSNRIRMAQALGIIDRPMRKRIEIIKEMRNVAAHSHAPVGLETEEIKEAIAALFPPEARAELVGSTTHRVRASWSTLAIRIASSLAAEEDLDVTDFWEWLRVQKLRPQTSRGKSLAASHRSRPPKAKKGK